MGKAFVLVDNDVAKPGFLRAWGLSVLVKIGDKHVLFDTGPTPMS